MNKLTRPGLLIAVAGLTTACTGAISDAGPEPDVPDVLACAPGESGVAELGLRLLMTTQYDNTLEALLGDTSRPASRFALPLDSGSLSASRQIAVETMEALWETAEEWGEQVAQDPGAYVDCATYDAACVAAFVADFGARAFRRPVSADEREELGELYASRRTDGDTFGEALGAVVTAVLVSPSLLYHVELPPLTAGEHALSPHELAARLSYFLWNRPPDEELQAMADSGAILDDDALRTQVDRMLEEPWARGTAHEFARRWLQLDRATLPESHPALPDASDTSAEAVARRDATSVALQREVELVMEDLVFGSDGTFADLFTSNVSFVDENLAPLYGIEPPPEGEMVRQPLVAEERSGLLTRAGVLAAAGESQVRRGVMVSNQILCGTFTVPPDGLPGSCAEPPTHACVTRADCESSQACVGGLCVPDPEYCIPAELPEQTVREHWESFPQACAGCHGTLNGYGFGFLRYDALGHYSTMDEAGRPIDDSGSFFGTPYQGAVELSALVAEHPDAQACFVKNWLHLALGSEPVSAGAECQAAAVYQRFVDSGMQLRSLLREIVLGPQFRQVRVTEAQLSAERT